MFHDVSVAAFDVDSRHNIDSTIERYLTAFEKSRMSLLLTSEQARSYERTCSLVQDIPETCDL